MIRTIHPVGQGAFYSEEFTKKATNQVLFTTVYDCGSYNGSKRNNAIKEIKERNEVDLLFISHFHEDHINGVEDLLEKNPTAIIVIPGVSHCRFIVDLISLYIRTGSIHSSSITFMMRCLPYLRQPGTSGSVFDIPASKSSYSKSGCVGKIYVIPPKSKHYTKFNICSLDWIYEVYYEIENKKECELIKELSEKIPILKDILSSLDTFRGIEWYKQLLKEISDLVRSNKINIDDIKGAYVAVFKKNHNAYSMLVYSHGASEKYIDYSCLYTGDAEAGTVINALQYFLPSYIQVPHHGSNHNHDKRLYRNDRIAFMSVGETNRYRHPGLKTLLCIYDTCKEIHVVTENRKYSNSINL